MHRHLTFEDIAHYPRPGTAGLRQIHFTPNSQKLAYLLSEAGTLQQNLWTYDIETGTRSQITGQEPAHVADAARSLDEELHRERARIRETGVTSYQYAPYRETGRSVLLVPLDGWLLIARGDEPLAPRAGTDGARDATLSPDGSQIAFVRNGALFVVPVDGDATPRQVSADAGEGVSYGLAEYIAQEEMGRQAGYWWSPDSTRLAFVRADSSHIPLYPIVHQGTKTLHVEEHRYPFAGKPNAAVQLGVVPADGDADDVRWMDLGKEDIYLARVAWRPDGTLTAIIESRDQRTLRLVAYEGNTSEPTTLVEEHSALWLNLNDDTRFLKSGELLWVSEKSGFRHLYLHDHEGQESHALTSGIWMVTEVLGVDENQRVVYFQGTRDGVLERHLYAVPLDGGTLRRLTREAGWHETVISPDYRYFVDTWSSTEHPVRVTLCSLADGNEQARLYLDVETSVAALGLCVPELTSFNNREGVLLQAAIYASDATRSGGQPRPLIVSVYGGPHAQTVTNSWLLTVDLRAQYLAQQGFVVLKVDNRGSANRGMAFESVVAGAFGQAEVDDQVDGVRFLASRAYVDATRAAIYGWSYGGYMTCRAMLRAPEVFKAGIAGAPVTMWDGYDTHYTERYLGLPQHNAAGYEQSNVLPFVDALTGTLLIVHGLVDENVHVRHTMRLITALTAAAKDYELVLFPEERHMPRAAADLEYLERRIGAFLQHHVGQNS